MNIDKAIQELEFRRQQRKELREYFMELSNLSSNSFKTFVASEAHLLYVKKLKSHLDQLRRLRILELI